MIKKEYIFLCKGNQGKQLLQQGYLQIRLYQLDKITRQEILKQYTKVANPTQQPMNLITRKQDFYIDMLLAKNQQLIATNDQQSEAITTDKIDFPLELQVIFPNQEWLIDSQVNLNINYFSLLHKIGEGTFAEIFVAQQKYDKKLVCLKRVNKTDFLQKASKQTIINEFTALKYRHCHKVNLLYMFQNIQFVYFVTDYCVFGNLYTLIRNQKVTHQCEECGKLQKTQKYSIWLQVAFMIVHMHQKGFVYRDLKPQNILIDERGLVRLCDFGYCTGYQKGQKFKQVCGTLQYIPPELVCGQGYEKSIDIYGLGILLYELIASKTPFQGITLDNMKERKRAAISFDKKVFSPLQRNLIQALTKQQPEQRLGYLNSLSIFKHPFFDQPQVISVIQSVIKREPNYHMLLKLHQPEYEQIQVKQVQAGEPVKFFQKPYNYLTPNIQIQEKMGPKFNSSF